MNNVQEEIYRTEAENKNRGILLNVIDKVVRNVIKDEKKANYLIRKLITAFLEITEGDKEEENLSGEEKMERSRAIASAYRERKHRKYLKDRIAFRISMDQEAKFTKNLALGTLGAKEEITGVKEKKKETFDELVNRLIKTRIGSVEGAGIR